VVPGKQEPGKIAVTLAPTKSVTGEKLVVLITDGDETCGGDAAGLDKPVVVLAAGPVA
jgi:hypothetical protein